MQHLKQIKRPRLATVLAGLALMIALGGTATAASGLINGKKIKNNSIPGKKLKNKTITKAKIAPATIKSLRGQTGQTGPQGPKGDQGAPGANGVVSPEFEDFGSVNIPDGGELGLGTVNVPAGKYMITATVRGFALGSGRMECFVSSNSGGGSSETSSWTSNGANQRNALPITYVTTTDTVTSISLGCGMEDTNGAASGTLTVVPVQ
ncbi:MAG: hypothetical protein J0H98_06120 [Solirubrobacterales bacterium]|nr:hypothetical protein [Solirubrobacterales bacterium]